jgi:hypothetical protein
MHVNSNASKGTEGAHGDGLKKSIWIASIQVELRTRVIPEYDTGVLTT